MGANRYENFECRVVKRSSIHGADYNPRTITENALKKIKKWFKTEGRGQLAPITVNKNTMTVVSGHQRLTVLDQLNKYPEKGDYELTVALADLDDKTEVEANVFMNNRSAMGDFDFELLSELKDMYPDISITEDFGFDESEIPLLFGELPDMAEMMFFPQKWAIPPRLCNCRSRHENSARRTSRERGQRSGKTRRMRMMSTGRFTEWIKTTMCSLLYACRMRRSALL